MFNNDRVLHWYIGAAVGWTILGALVSIPVHIIFGIPFLRLAIFLAIQCALQIVVTPWLFAARATVEVPAGKLHLRAVVVIVWFMIAAIAAYLQLRE